MQCSRCNYDLRGADPGGDCPECGEAVANSLRGPLLRYADRPWSKHLVRGLAWVVWSRLALLVLVLFCYASLMIFAVAFATLDTDTKLVPCHLVGKRTRSNTHAFVADLASRIEGRIQISSDMMEAYAHAVDESFGGEDFVDYGRIVKQYEAEPIGPGRYSPPEVKGITTDTVIGAPVGICTSHVERQNLTMRMNMRRFTRLTNGFSKKVENLRCAVALHFGFYNFCRIHSSLRVTPAMAAGVTSRVWDLGELVDLGNSA